MERGQVVRLDLSGILPLLGTGKGKLTDEELLSKISKLYLKVTNDPTIAVLQKRQLVHDLANEALHRALDLTGMNRLDIVELILESIQHIVASANSPSLTSLSLMIKGLCLRRSENLPESLIFLRNAESICIQDPDYSILGRIQLNLSALLIQLSKLEEALQFARKAGLCLAKAIGRTTSKSEKETLLRDVALANYNMGYIYRESGIYSESKESLRRAVNSIEASGSKGKHLLKQIAALRDEIYEVAHMEDSRQNLQARFTNKGPVRKLATSYKRPKTVQIITVDQEFAVDHPKEERSVRWTRFKG